MARLRLSPFPKSCWALMLALLAAWLNGHELRAQNLLLNGGFTGGATSGWTGNPDLIGFVGEQGGPNGGVDSWIGLRGEISQEIPTTAGDLYALVFSVQAFRQGSYRPNSLTAYWDDERVAQIEFTETDFAWLRPRIVLKAGGSVSRLRFVGTEFPSLDAVSVVPIGNPAVAGRIVSPVEGAKYLEDDSIEIAASWDVPIGASTPATTGFYLNGTVLLGTASGIQPALTWSNAPPGSYSISAQSSAGWLPPVRVTVATRPKVQILSPKSQEIFPPGTVVHSDVALLNNDGSIVVVRFELNGSIAARVTPTGNYAGFDWTISKAGTTELVAVGENAAGAEVHRASVTVQAIGAGIQDQTNPGPGGGLSFIPTQPVAQVFTAGTSGRLRHVLLPFSHNNGLSAAPMTVAIHDAVDGLPGTNRLAATTLLPSEAYIAPNTVMARFAFLSNFVYVVAGRQYAIVLETGEKPGAETSARMTSGDTYRGGALFQRRSGTWRTTLSTGFSLSGWDLEFTTFVIPYPIPSVAFFGLTNSASFQAGAPIPLQTLHANTGIALDSTRYFADGVELTGIETRPGLGRVWTNPPPGNHILWVECTDILGGRAVSFPVSILSGLEESGLPRIRIEASGSPEGNRSIPPLVFPITLSAPSPVPVTVEYRTFDMTAVAPVDYLADAGTIAFMPGQTQTALLVRIAGDTVPEPYKQLRVVLFNPSNAVIEEAGAIGTIFDDEPGEGKVASLRWELPDGEHSALTPFNARLVATDPANAGVDTVPGPVKLATEVTSAESFSLLENLKASPPLGFNPPTIGYGFRPRQDLLVTHLRCRGGRKVTLWNEEGTALATAAFSGKTSAWEEIPLGYAVRLRAGVRYRISLFSTGAAGYYEEPSRDSPYAYREGTFSSPEDAFPYLTTISPSLVPADFRFLLAGSPAKGIEPSTADFFVGGIWSSEVQLLTAGEQVRLTATDLLGHIALSPPLRVAVGNALSIEGVRGESATFLLHGPAGRRVQVESSLDLLTWTSVGAAQLLGGPTQTWTAPDGLDDVRFFRLVLVP